MFNGTKSIFYVSKRFMGRGPTIQSRKDAVNVKKKALFDKLVKEIMAVSKSVQGDTSNARLAAVITKAKSSNMPRDNIERAVKVGSQGKDGTHAEMVTYEGHGPYGSAFMIETLTDNRKRTAPALRSILGNYGGSLGVNGSVSWMFDRKGYLELSCTTADSTIKIDEDDLLEVVIDGGGDDMEINSGIAQIYCDPPALYSVRNALINSVGCPEIAELVFLPKEYINLSDEAEQSDFNNLIEALNDNDDVHQIHHNISDLI